MTKQTLNITNGSSLTEYLEKEKYEGEMLTWHEMLCEGPTEKEIDTTSFFETRKAFLESVYDAEYDILKIQSEIQKTNNNTKSDINNQKTGTRTTSSCMFHVSCFMFRVSCFLFHVSLFPCFSVSWYVTAHTCTCRSSHRVQGPQA